MSRTEANNHPTVAPLLAAWRNARAERDRVTLDGRFGVTEQARTEKAAQDAAAAYEQAVLPLLG